MSTKKIGAWQHKKIGAKIFPKIGAWQHC